MPHHFPRPQEKTLDVKREKVEGSTCPECGSGDIARYPVVAEAGWVLVVKCQDCLYSIEREPWHRLGSISLLSETL
jgi:hypothetical protein